MWWPSLLIPGTLEAKKVKACLGYRMSSKPACHLSQPQNKKEKDDWGRPGDGYPPVVKGLLQPHSLIQRQQRGGLSNEAHDLEIVGKCF